MKKLIIILAILVLSACNAARVTPGRADATATLSPEPTNDFLFATKTPEPEPGVPLTTISTGIPNPTATEIRLTVTLEPTQKANPRIQAGQSIKLASLRMIDAATGWGTESGGHILHTRDGGNTWQDVTPPQGSYNESGFFALDANMAWATLKPIDSCDASQMTWGEYQKCMPGPDIVIWRTVDGGQTWQAGEPYEAENLHYKPVALQFSDTRVGWFLYVSSFGPMGSTTMGLARTEDGGISWVFAYAPQSMCIHRAMVFINAQDGWSGYDCRFVPIDWIPFKDFVSRKVTPELYRTSDGAKSVWGDTDTLPSPQVFPAELSASSADPNLLIFCGTTSMKQISPQAFTMRWTCSSKSGASPRAEFSYEYLTPDGGQTWSSWLATGNESFVNASVGWRLYSPGKGQMSQLQQTSDGGQTWAAIKTVSWQTSEFDFINEQVGWVIVNSGDASALVHTTNGGQTWEEIKPVIGNR